MTEQEIRLALVICDMAASLASAVNMPLESFGFAHAVADPRTGYAAALRDLLKARELLRAMKKNCDCKWCARVRAFLAEGESK